jgi:hypothetical protein
MCIAVIGGVKRLEPHYLREGERMGIELRLFNDPGAEVTEKIARADAVIIFTNMVSHNARRLAKKAARIQGIPVFMHHACGLCTLRECLGCLMIHNNVRGACDRSANRGVHIK